MMMFHKQIKKNSLILETLEFDWMLAYGSKNYIDFRTLKGKIVTIDGPNDVGKSSLMEIICLSIFGKAIPSRATTGFSGEIINSSKPKDECALTRIQFKQGEKVYVIQRKYGNTASTRLKNQGADQILYEYENGILKEYKQKANLVDGWVNQNIGAIDTFLLSCMLTQNQDKDFFSLVKRKPFEILDKTLNLENIKAIQNVFNESALAIEHIKKRAETLYTHIENQSTNYDEKLAESTQQKMETKKSKSQKWKNQLKTWKLKSKR